MSNTMIENDVMTGAEMPAVDHALAQYEAQPLVVATDHPMATLLNPALYQQLRVAANHFAKSNLVPKRYRDNPIDIFVALHMSWRLGADPLLIMQNTHVINGEPGFKTPFIIAQANRSGVFKSRLRFDTEVLSPALINVKRKIIEWKDGANGRRSRSEHFVDAQVADIAVTASAVLAGDASGAPVSRRISMRDAIAAGWTDNVKYSEIGEQMLSYRAAAFLIRLYAQDALMLPPVDEIEDTSNGGETFEHGETAPTAGAAGVMGKLMPQAAAPDPEPQPKPRARRAKAPEPVAVEQTAAEDDAIVSEPAEVTILTMRSTADMMDLVRDCASLADCDYVRSLNNERVNASQQSRDAVTGALLGRIATLRGQGVTE